MVTPSILLQLLQLLRLIHMTNQLNYASSECSDPPVEGDCPKVSVPPGQYPVRRSLLSIATETSAAAINGATASPISGGATGTATTHSVMKDIVVNEPSVAATTASAAGFPVADADIASSLVGRMIAALAATDTASAAATAALAGGNVTEEKKVCGSRKKNSLERIVGGTETLPHEYPWQAVLELAHDGHGGFFNCGATLIHPSWVLTAAHCAVSPMLLVGMVYLGLHRSRLEGKRGPDEGVEAEVIESCQKTLVKTFVVHEEYNAATNENDIALLELHAPATLGPTIQTVCLATPTTEFVGNVGTVLGWGLNAYRKGQTQVMLQSANLVVVKNAICKFVYSRVRGAVITDRMFCAYYAGRDACQGDSGGPFLREVSAGRQVQSGVISYGLECAQENTPGVYTNVAMYTEWIRNSTRDANICFC